MALQSLNKLCSREVNTALVSLLLEGSLSHCYNINANGADNVE